MEWFLIAAILGGLFGSKSIGKKYGSAKRSAKAKFKANNPLSESYWKKRIPPNQRLSNLGKALATPPTKKSQSASKVNRHNKKVIDNHKREREQADHDRQKAEQEAEKLRGKLHEASVLFEQIGTLATSYPSHWVQRVRTLSGKGVSVTSGA